MRIKLTMTGLAIAALAAACAIPAATTASGGSSSTTSYSPYTAHTTSPSPTPTPENLTAHFGESRVYKDGIAVTVAAPIQYSPTRTSIGAQPGNPCLEFAVTIVNGTANPWDASMVRVSASGGGGEGSQVFDAARNIGGAPSTMVIPGKSVTWNVVFSVPAVTDPVLQVTPGFQYQTSIFIS